MSNGAVLLVDDDPTMLKLNTQILEDGGYIVLPSRNLREAREIMEYINPQAAVLDVDLSDGSGFDFCRELRETRPKRIPIFFVTGRNRDADRTAGLAAGADGYIVKPFLMETLLDGLSGALAKLKEADVSKQEESI